MTVAFSASKGNRCLERMAAPDFNDEDVRREQIDQLEPDLHGLLQRKEVSAVTQAKLAYANCKSLSRFHSIADDRAQLRAFANNTLRLDNAIDVMEIAALVDSWEAARVRMEVRHKAEAEASVSSLPISLPKVEVQDLIKKFETAHYKLEDKITPAASTLELIFDQVENGELKTMYLQQFLSREDAEVEPVGAMLDKSGTVKIKKGYGETKEPASGEELRHRLKIVSHAFLMCQLKYPQRTIFQDLTPQDFLQYADYLLSEQVMGLKAEDEDGNKVSSPTLKLVLSYEHQIRKETIKQVNTGVKLQEALLKARKDVVIKERYFLTPVAMNAMTSGKRERSRSPKHDRDSSSYRSNKPSWNSSRNKGQGKGKKGKEVLHSTTPDGRQICFKWNSMKERCRYKCGRVHVCQRCLSSEHPLHMCKVKKDKDTQGEGDASASTTSK